MSHLAVDDRTADPDHRAKRNVAVLAFANAVLGSQLAINIIVAGLAGALLAENPSLATLPISILVAGSLLAAPVVSLFMGRYGRRAGFLVGALAGGSGGVLCARALFVGSFELFLAGSVLLGIYQASQGFFRFAAADTGSEGFKPKAISWVFAGGLLSALIGPEIVRLTSAAFTTAPYAGAYLAVDCTQCRRCPLPLVPRHPAPGARGRHDRHGAATCRDRAATRVHHRSAVGDGGVRIDEPRDDVDAARLGRSRLYLRSCRRRRPLAHPRDVRAEFFDGLVDRALRSTTGHHRGAGLARRVRSDCLERRRPTAFLSRARCARRRLESRVHRRDEPPRHHAYARRAGEGTGPERFPGARLGRRGVVWLRGAARCVRLERGSVRHGAGAAGRSGRRRMAGAARAQNGPTRPWHRLRTPPKALQGSDLREFRHEHREHCARDRPAHELEQRIRDRRGQVVDVCHSVPRKVRGAPQ